MFVKNKQLILSVNLQKQITLMAIDDPSIEGEISEQQLALRVNTIDDQQWLKEIKVDYSRSTFANIVIKHYQK